MPSAKRPADPEFALRILPHVNERTRRPSTLVQLLTTKSFANFRYELAVDERREGNILHLTILGLKAPQLDLPAAGPAEFRREYDGWQGKHCIVVHGLDGSITTIRFRVNPKGIVMDDPLPQGIIKLDTPPSTTKRRRPE